MFLIMLLEHIMPISWDKYWGIDKVPVYDSKGKCIKNTEDAEAERNLAIFQIGNMALLTGSLNSSISNYDIERKVHGAPGARLKDTKGIKDYATLMTTRNVVEEYEKNNYWDERSIAKRSVEITEIVNSIWSIE